MHDRVQKRWRVFWLSLGAVLSCAGLARAATLLLDAFVFYSILGANGLPLQNGSFVHIFASIDPINDGVPTIGTNLIAAGTQGDDILLGTVYIGDNVTSAGTFFITLPYDAPPYDWVYIRFFDTTNTHGIGVGGLVAWGTSMVFNLTSNFDGVGVSTVQFDPNGSLQVTQTNNFLVIPEPSTSHLIVLVLGMIWVMRSTMRRKATAKVPG